MKKLLLLVMVLLLAGCSGPGGAMEPIDSNDTAEFEYTVRSGSNLTRVSRELEELGYIRSAKAMVDYAEDKQMTNIKAGTYMISKNMSSSEIVTMLYQGKVFRGKKFVVQEGLEAIQIANKVEAEGLGSSDKFMELVNDPSIFVEEFPFLKDPSIRSLEGYLYPLTYDFKESDGEEYIIRTMLKSFDHIYVTEIEPKLAASGKTLNEVIILASIVEREAALADEMPLVASVFDNRLMIDMPLQSCATVQYILKERRWILSNEEIAIDSPYNTYKYKGLPITAIASPSITAIQAVLEHPETEYMYFLSKNDGTGSQIFAVTYEEHLKNKKKYLG